MSRFDNIHLGVRDGLKPAFLSAARLWSTYPTRRQGLMDLIDAILDLHNTVQK